MDGRAVNLRVAGQSYRVVSTTNPQDLQRLADRVTAKLEELSPPGRAAHPQAVVLAAIALAHDLEQERARRQALERRTRDMLRRVLGRIDTVLGTDE